MAEVKNAFIKSKMNKDLDARLIPNGEYRDAINVQISKSEGDDVGALENVLGNFSIADFIEDSGVSNLTCIGHFADEYNEIVYLFFTDYTDNYDTAFGATYNENANNFIYSFDLKNNSSTSTITKLVQGSFLNFSTTRPITGINLLENLLFFTDNRNQPRKINVQLALDEGVDYYTNEDQISVAKYYPYQCIDLIKLSDQVQARTSGTLVEGVTDSNVLTVSGLSFDRIQPGQYLTGDGVDENVFLVDWTIAPNELDVIATINKDQTLAANISLTFTQFETTMYNVSDQYIVPNVETPSPDVENPYYEENFPGDPKYLEDKFVRFSYRFKFIDGEYSVLAPFTQPCFIPKQDGYFLEGDEQQTFASTIVEFMENKVDKINLQIPLPTAVNSILSDYHISEIDIVYKESDALAVQVVESISVNDIQVNTDSSTFIYSYNSTKPYKTLPESEITRVYDKVPVRALGQEVSSNRIIYANFLDKHTPPSAIDYQVSVGEKYENNNTDFKPARSRIEYPNHSLKENRNYQVGIVLSDRYGRQSTVLLSNNTSQSEDTFGADTVYLPYRDIVDAWAFGGDSLKVLFNKIISSDYNESIGTPGLYNGDVNDSEYNPLGWYTYKIVVKQIQQEYYNVYTSGAMKDVPYDYIEEDPPNATNTVEPNTSFLTLLNDNINKVPRDLSQVGPQDKTFRSSVVLFGRVENTAANFSNIGNKQYVPIDRNLSFTTNNIEDLFDLFDVLQFKQGNEVLPITDVRNPYFSFYKSDSNPFIAEFITTIQTDDQFGVFNTKNGNDYNRIENLTVLETAPVVSRLDIYYETSTSGILSELNEAIGGNTGTGVTGFNYTHSEADAPDSTIVDGFSFTDPIGNVVTPDSLPTITSVIDNSSSGTNRASEFSLVQGDTTTTYNLKTALEEYFYYGSNGSTLESYTFTFSVTVGGETTAIETQGALSNASPSIDNDNSSTINVDTGEVSILTNITGKNGSNTNNPDTNVYTQGLTFSIASSTGSGTFSIVNNNEVQNSDASATGSGSFDLRVTDAGGATADKTFNVNFGQPTVPSDFVGVYFLGDAQGNAIWFTNNTTNLEANTPSYLSNWLNGFEAPTALNSNVTNDLCTSGSTNTARFINDTTSTDLTQGTFYVYINAVCLDDGGTDSNVDLQPGVNIRYAIQYRANSSSAWSTAVDKNNVVPSINGTWYYIEGANEPKGWETLNNDYPGSGISIQIREPAPDGQAGRVFAFDNTGEYRIIVGNVQSNYAAPDFPSNTGPAYNNSVDCSQFTNLNIFGFLFTNDFFNPSGEVAPDFDTYGSVYRYEMTLSNSFCSSSFTGATTFYAAEPFANYVTQLYTDINLTTPATLTGTSVRRYRRMYRTNPASTDQDPYNPEFCLDGAYRAEFNSNGLRTGTPIPCLYT